MKIKICGLFREEDIDAVNETRPDWAGFVIGVPTSHRNVSVDKVAHLVSRLAKDILPVGVFLDMSADGVADCAQKAGLSAVQLHGSEDEAYISRLRDALDARSIECQIWKAFKVTDEESVARARNSSADMILLDGGTGQGKAFDWELCSIMDRPFIVAGGLGPANVAEAFERTGAFACDMSSGVETDKIKDPAKIRAAIESARSIN